MMAVIETLKTSIKGMFGGGTDKDRVLGIDIGSSSIKLIELKREYGRLFLQTYGEIFTGPYGDRDKGDIVKLTNEQTVEALTNLIEQSKATTRRSAVSIRSSSSLVRIMSISGRVPEETLGQVVPNEARKYIPVPISEVMLDWWRIPQTGRTPADATQATKLSPTKADYDILVAAVHNDTINDYQQIVDGAKLGIAFYEIEVFSAVRATFHHEISPVMIVDYGASGLRIAIAEHGIVRTFNVSDRGAVQITRAIAQSQAIPFERAEELKREIGLNASERYPDIPQICAQEVQYVRSEMNNVLLSFEKKYGKALDKIILTGGGTLLPGFVDFVRRELGFTIVHGDAFAKAETPEFLEHIVRGAGPEFSVAMGLAVKALE